MTERAAHIYPAVSTTASLPDTASPRKPRFALLRRPQQFFDAFEQRALFYDCFWHHDGQRVVLVGPPPVNLDYGTMVFGAGRSQLAARVHASASVCITELAGVPPGTSEISVSFAGHEFSLPIQPNHCAELSDSRLLFTINRNNELSWVREWAHWHARNHGTDAIVLVDNGSTSYGIDDLRETLVSVPGIRHVAVHGWPQTFGPPDPAVLNFREWSRFLQLCSMSMVLRRYGMLADGVLNCDIDELTMTHSGRPIYDLASDSPGGLIVFRGTWVEAQPEPGAPQRPPHSAYRHVLADPKAARSAQRKWALDPSRPWVERLSVHPYWHWVEGRDRKAKSMPPDATYFHFRGISTNWKDPRNAPPASATVRSAELDRGFDGMAQ